MGHTPHELHEEFPEFSEKLTTLKETDAHFARLNDGCHEINSAVLRAETDVEPTDDLHLSEMRKQRIALKDQIYAMLTHA